MYVYIDTVCIDTHSVTGLDMNINKTTMNNIAASLASVYGWKLCNKNKSCGHFPAIGLKQTSSLQNVLL